MFCVFSVNSFHLTTLIVAGCGNITDAFLLTSFVPGVSVKINSSSSMPVSSVQESRAVSGSRQTMNSGNVVSEQSFQCGSSSAFDRARPADACNRESYKSAAVDCGPQCGVDYNGQCTDTPVQRPFSAERLDSYVTAAAGAVRGCQSVVSCGRLNQSEAEYCSRKTRENDDWTNRSYKLEHLDVSGCWRITDLSIRCV